MRHRSRDYLPHSFGWIKGMAVFWLFLGGILLIRGVSSLLSGASLLSSGCAVGLFFGSVLTIIPIGVLCRARWAFYGGLALSAFMLLGFPIGTFLGVITIKAYADGKLAFGIH